MKSTKKPTGMKELKLHFYPKGPHDLELRHLFKASLRNKRFN